ncbi:hypothetical protein AB3M83_12120 [Microbacterium sp. 179-B 1A2 NHS]|uniref:hypothetical protein n=1 Tax=Microbacterium sp. 179-B 1A2 NHS TaxID=3142383 RepID=UPI0039A1AEF9
MAGSKSRVGREIADMVRDRRIDGMVRMLARRHGAPLVMVEDAVSSAAVSVLERSAAHDIDDVAGYFFRAADNKLKRLLMASNRHSEFDELEHPRDDEFDDRLPMHSDVDAQNLLDWFKSLTRDWNTNLRVTVDIALDAAFSIEYDEPTSEELATELESVLMQPVTPVNARQWKSRALRRLRDEVTAHFAHDLDQIHTSTDGEPE